MLSETLAVGSGAIVGFLLALLGGGGSILAVPLLLYAVGIKDAHVAIGTSAVAVSFSAALNLGLHTHDRNVKWPCASVFAACGIVGALAGAHVAQKIDAAKLLLAFAVAMLGVAISLLLRPPIKGNPDVRLNSGIAVPLILTGTLAGFASGFFGIGGGFLIAPGLIRAANMTFIHAIGSSLVAVTAFAGATALSYAMNGFVNWPMASLFIVGGLVGGFAGRLAGRRLAARQLLLGRLLVVVIIVTAVYIAVQSLL